MPNDSIQIRHIRRAPTCRILTLALGASILTLGWATPSAAQSGPLPKEHRPMGGGSVKASPSAPVDEGPFCLRARRKLWVEGEGWIVRRVNLCR